MVIIILMSLIGPKFDYNVYAAIAMFLVSTGCGKRSSSL